MKKYLVVIVSILISCSDKENLIQIQSLPENETKFQKMIIGQITGKEKIQMSSGESMYLKSRWSEKERMETLNYLESLINKLDLVAYRQHYTMPNSNFAVDLLIEPLEGTNIYTFLPSTNNSDEYIVIGAHYDTDGRNFPGAIDNGSGIALITSALRRLKEVETRNKNLIAVYFDQEEESISAGSLAFAKFLKTNNYNIHSIHSYDLIGWDGDKNKEVQLEFPTPNPVIKKIYMTSAKELDIPIFSIRANSSDYASFFKEGFTNVVGMSQAYAKGDVSGKKDSPEDKYHLVDFAYLSSSTNLAFNVLEKLLND